MFRVIYFLILLLVHCSLSVVGSDTIKKEDAELNIGLAQVAKAWFCGLDENSLFAGSLGNGERKYDFIKRDQYFFSVYEKKAVDRCIQAIYAMPCPELEITPSGKPYMPYLRKEFLEILVATRRISCTFETISIWEGKEFMQGRVY